MTVAIESLPPTTVDGFSVSEVSVTGLIVKLAVLVTPAAVPDMVAVVLDRTLDVVMVNVAVVAPA